MNTSLSKLRPQLILQANRLLSSSSNTPSKKDPQTSLAKNDQFMVKKLNTDKFLSNKAEDSTYQLENIRIETEVSDDITKFNGVPREYIDNRRARIFKQAKNAMQSATNDTKVWKIEFETRDRWENPLMGWTSSGDSFSNLVLQFTNKEDAIHFCEKNGWTYSIDEPQVSKRPKIKSYAANFAWSSRTRTGSK